MICCFILKVCRPVSCFNVCYPGNVLCFWLLYYCSFFDAFMIEMINYYQLIIVVFRRSMSELKLLVIVLQKSFSHKLTYSQTSF